MDFRNIVFISSLICNFTRTYLQPPDQYLRCFPAHLRTVQSSEADSQFPHPARSRKTTSPCFYFSVWTKSLSTLHCYIFACLYLSWHFSVTNGPWVMIFLGTGRIDDILRKLSSRSSFRVKGSWPWVQSPGIRLLIRWGIFKEKYT